MGHDYHRDISDVFISYIDRDEVGENTKLDKRAEGLWPPLSLLWLIRYLEPTSIEYS